MSNQETEEKESKIEKKSASESSQEQAQESTSLEAQKEFAPGQGKAHAEDRKSDSAKEVQTGSLPKLDLFDAKKEGNDRSKHPEKENSGEKPQRGRHEHEHKHEHGRAHDHAGHGPAEEPQEIVDPDASPVFRKEVEDTKQRVLQGMPEHLQKLLKDTPLTAVKSMSIKETGDLINGRHGPEGIFLSEERDGNAPLDTILKHEYGHEFDMTRNPSYSEDPEFRKRIDEAIENDPQLKAGRDENPDDFYAEMFADLFASNLGADGKDLTLPHADRKMAAAKEWVKQQMMAGARKK